MLALSLAMVLTMSAPVFAGDEETEPTVVTSIKQLNELLKEGGKLNLKLTNTNDTVTDSITIPKNANVTLDLNGDTLDESINGPTILVSKGATLTLTNTNTSKTSVVENNMNGQPAIRNNGTCILEGNLTCQDTGSDTYYVIQNHGDMTINSPVTVEIGNPEKSALIENGYYGYHDTDPNSGYVSDVNHEHPSLTINGGTFTGGRSNIKNDDGGIVTINDGTFSGSTNAVLNWNKMTINGGAFTSIGNNIENYADKSANGLDEGTITINDGTFNSRKVSDDKYEAVFATNGSNSVNATNIINGGTFNGPLDSTPSDNKFTITGGTFKDNIGKDANKPDKFKITGGTFAEMPDASSIKSGYSVKKNSDGTYTIEPTYLSNSWTEKLTITGWTYGGKANAPSAKALYGDVTYKYYDKDKNLIGTTAPTEAGNYFVKAFVTGAQSDSGYYGSLESDYVAFTISKSADSLTTPLTISNWTYGETPSTPSAKAKEGTVEYRYYDKDGNQLTEAPSLPGTYYVTAFVKGDNDRADFESEKVEFRIYRPALRAKATKRTSTSETIHWTKVNNADGYYVYYSRCGKTLKRFKSTKTNRTVVRKGLRKGKVYKYQVKAYKIVDGKKVVVASSYKMHAVAGGYNSRYTDAKTVEVADSDITVAVDKNANIKASLTKVRSGRTLLAKGHTERYRYSSGNRNIAYVSSTGRISAYRAGECSVYVIAPNGTWRTVHVTVVDK